MQGLPEQDENGIRDKLFCEIKLEDLKKDDGVETDKIYRQIF